MENAKITSMQMAMLMYPTIFATAVTSLPSIMAQYAKQDLWLSSILASVIGFLTAYIAIRLHRLYPQKTIFQICEQTIGKPLGKIIGFLILFFYIHTNGTIVRDYGEFIVSSFLYKTPIIIVMILMVLLCAFCVYSGLEVLARTAQLFFPVFVIPLIILIFLLIPYYEFDNILPVFGDGLMPALKGAIIPSGWFTEFFLIMFLLPFLTDEKKAAKYAMLTVFYVMISLLVINLMVYFVIGQTTANRVYSMMVAVRFISYANFFENLNSVIMALWIVGAFVKISVFYFAVALGTAQWLNLTDYRPLVWPIGILTVELSLWSMHSAMSTIGYNRVFLFWGALIQTFIPLGLWVVASLRNRRKSETRSG